ncbi:MULTISPECIES: phage terminase small subunit P27 family [unclassified Levilactobacillus]|uniref:phage terminase small subunit P27 family n=1 Tax=unclassified Levilactobacillus TaxID=2767918 RepID=UPI002FEF2F00
MVKKQFKDANGGRLASTPPKYLGTQAKAVWRKVVPFLEQESSVKRIDFGLVEMYVTQYEIYRNAYKHILENHEVQPIYKSLQNAAGEIVGEDFIGYKRNPMTQIYDSAVRNLTKIGSELGLSPKSRSELMKISVPDDSDDEKSVSERMKEFLG